MTAQGPLYCVDCWRMNHVFAPHVPALLALQASELWHPALMGSKPVQASPLTCCAFHNRKTSAQRRSFQQDARKDAAQALNLAFQSSENQVCTWLPAGEAASPEERLMQTWMQPAGRAGKPLSK